MKTLIASTFAIMVLASSAFAGHGHGQYSNDDADAFGTDRYWEQVGQGNQ